MSDAYAVDTSVFLRWWVDQVGWQHARRVRDDFLAGAIRLATADFTRIELANVLRKKGLLRDQLTEDEYLVAVRSLDDLGVDVVALSVDDLERAASLAVRRNLRMYDALGAALALDRGVPLLTADIKSARALTGVVDVEVLEGVGS